MLDWDTAGRFRMAALQSNAGRALLQRCGRRPDDISSIVLVQDNTCYTKSEAILRIGAGLGTPLPLLAAFGFPLPLFFRDSAYDVVADNRYLVFGRTGSCRLSQPGYQDRFIED